MEETIELVVTPVKKRYFIMMKALTVFMDLT